MSDTAAITISYSISLVLMIGYVLRVWLRLHSASASPRQPSQQQPGGETEQSPSEPRQVGRSTHTMELKSPRQLKAW